MSAVLCFLMLTGLKQSIAQDVEVGLNLPYSGNYNEWSIKFTNQATSEVFYFETDDDSFDSHILGTMPAGTYTIEFDSAYFPWYGFDFGVCGNDYYHFRTSNSSFTWYSAVIDASTVIQIDEGY